MKMIILAFNIFKELGLAKLVTNILHIVIAQILHQSFAESFSSNTLNPWH